MIPSPLRQKNADRSQKNGPIHGDDGRQDQNTTVHTLEDGMAHVKMGPQTTLENLRTTVYAPLLADYSRAQQGAIIQAHLEALGVLGLGQSIGDVAPKNRSFRFSVQGLKAFIKSRIRAGLLSDNRQGQQSAANRRAAQEVVKPLMHEKSAGAFRRPQLPKKSPKAAPVKPTDKIQDKIHWGTAAAKVVFMNTVADLAASTGFARDSVANGERLDAKTLKALVKNEAANNPSFANSIKVLMGDPKINEGQMAAMIRHGLIKAEKVNGVGIADAGDVAKELIDIRADHLKYEFCTRAAEKVAMGTAQLQALLKNPDLLQRWMHRAKEMSDPSAQDQMLRTIGLDSDWLQSRSNIPNQALVCEVQDLLKEQIKESQYWQERINGGQAIGLAELFPDLAKQYLQPPVDQDSQLENTLENKAKALCQEREEWRSNVDWVGRFAVTMAATVATGGEGFAFCALLAAGVNAPELMIRLGEAENKKFFETAGILPPGTSDAERERLLKSYAKGVAVSGALGYASKLLGKVAKDPALADEVALRLFPGNDPMRDVMSKFILDAAHSREPWALGTNMAYTTYSALADAPKDELK